MLEWCGGGGDVHPVRWSWSLSFGSGGFSIMCVCVCALVDYLFLRASLCGCSVNGPGALLWIGLCNVWCDWTIHGSLELVLAGKILKFKYLHTSRRFIVIIARSLAKALKNSIWKKSLKTFQAKNHYSFLSYLVNMCNLNTNTHAQREFLFHGLFALSRPALKPSAEVVAKARLLSSMCVCVAEGLPPWHRDDNHDDALRGCYNLLMRVSTAF